LGIKVTEIKVEVSEGDAVKISNDLGFPVVMKISSPDILHKSGAIKAWLSGGF
jgi:acyl-CoA synthetase (NDP forming)